MGRKMKLIPFLFKAMESPSSSSSWPWPACGNPKTLSFRAEKIMNPVYVTEDESRLTDSSESDSAGGSIVSITTELEEEESGGGESIENVIRGLTKSERLFFEPGTSCIVGGELQAAAKTNIISTKDGLYVPIKQNGFVVMEMESRDPFVDFKKSMEEMVEAHGLNYLKDWDCLEELLNWYLRVNGKCNHGYIVGAFVDLLVALDFPTFISSPPSPCPSCDDTFTTTHSPVSALSSSSSSSSSLSSSSSSTCNSSTVIPCLSSLEEEEEEEEEPAAHDDHNKEKRVLEDV